MVWYFHVLSLTNVSVTTVKAGESCSLKTYVWAVVYSADFVVFTGVETHHVKILALLNHDIVVILQTV